MAWGGGWPCGTGGAFDRSCSPGGGVINFLPLKKGGLLEGGGLFERGA